ncbi:hypothetical protein BIY21_20205 [Vibrio ponticus]|uniref:Type I restriction enzyme R protein N-terminal domain-containing protein n=1 Tax=Vibrio ponticus TaxID=265668 RepID=A0ABX3F3K4_9VIBR|nr:hypothetical protein [Vibrio ponticus]OLQ84378.1 hypothetical protein BIY21_20205 [Vibrio ponticus]
MDRKKSEGEKLFSEFLTQKGFPSGSVIYDPEWIVVEAPRRHYRPDFLIIEPKRKEVLAAIEVKDCRVSNAGKLLYRDLDLYRKARNNERMPIYLVALLPNDTEVKIYGFDENHELSEIDYSLFPTYDALCNQASIERKGNLVVKSDKITNSFKLTTTLLAFLSLLIVIADFTLELFGIKLLSAERLTLVGGSIALLLMPYIQKFKGLGVEWEREKESS